MKSINGIYKSAAEKYTVSLCSTKLPIIISSLSGEILEINSGGQLILGYSVEELSGEDIKQIFGDVHDYEKFIKIIKKNGSVDNLKVILRCKNGEKLTCLVSSNLQYDDETLHNYIITFFTDITRYIQAEKKDYRVKNIDTIGLWVSGIAHDFNNMLTVMIGNAEVALLSTSPDHPNYEKVKEVVHAGRRASNLTNRLLAFCRNQIIEPRILNLNTEVIEMDSLFRNLIGEKIEFTTGFAENLWPIKIDPGQIEQLLTNLIINARDAMPEGGTLAVETSNVVLKEDRVRNKNIMTPGDYVLITVRDSGTGIDEDVLSRIFEPYYTTKENGKGTGLGLFICYGIVKQNKGYIWIDSDKGQGTVVNIYFPRVFI
ncbi:MAG: PAS domain S-box protein [Candidatus Latescibacteria bacterium]|nr:PAS domain S-box protein [Candidatus Latescibacterota bacterium]